MKNGDTDSSRATQFLHDNAPDFRRTAFARHYATIFTGTPLNSVRHHQPAIEKHNSVIAIGGFAESKHDKSFMTHIFATPVAEMSSPLLPISKCTHLHMLVHEGDFCEMPFCRRAWILRVPS